MLRFAFAAFFLCASIGFVAGPVRAQVTEPVKVPVQTDDLNLRSIAGQKTLDRRLEQAADKACGTSAGTNDLAALSAQRQCRAQVKQSGSAQATSIVAREDARERSQRAALVASALAASRLSADRAKSARYTPHRRVKHKANRKNARSHHPVRAKRPPAQ